MWGPNGHWEEPELQWEAMMILKTGVMCSDLDTHSHLAATAMWKKGLWGPEQRQDD